MSPASHRNIRVVILSALASVLLLLSMGPAARAAVPVSNLAVRVMTANITDNSQSYEDFGLRIIQGLKPDIVAIQEFNYRNNTPGDFRAMIDAVLGTNYTYFRETGYSIPNGIISRWPITASGSWDDVTIPDRGFAWARVDLPGTNDLYVVSVHLKASGGSESTRATEAANLRTLITANFPAHAPVVVAGDMNFQSRSTSAEPGLATLRAFLSDEPAPTDSESGGDPDTNQPRSRPYDYVLPNFILRSNQVAVAIGARLFTNGLVFDSRVYSPLSDVAPVQAGDSGLAQHMAVVKDFRIGVFVDEGVEVPRPRLAWESARIIRWQGPSNLTYTVQGSVLLTNWDVVGTASSATTNYAFTNDIMNAPHRFFRVRHP
jgi:endonuclease/exonuclease/phosphatase family metal-dependent hydrolase